ncbi:MAG: hypothetical protein CSA95_07495 [Bacteroidetes bacterium]|nr:MAG: hypothetical protein CSA95_07495 [Bacteroidota bacterium]
MKNRITILLAAVAFLFAFTPSAQAQKPFKGVITYQITYPGVELDPMMQAQLPTIMTFTTKDYMGKMEMTTNLYTQGEIINAKERSMITFMEAMGKKFKIIMDAEMIREKKEEAPKPVIEKTGDTKEIAGYKCKMATVSMTLETGQEIETDVYYTDEIYSPAMDFNNEFEGIEGFPFEYIMDMGQMKMKFSVMKVKKGNVKKSDFILSDEYQEVTEEELKSMFGGM